MKDKCSVVIWLLLGIAIEIAVISFLFNRSIEKEKKFKEEIKVGNKTYYLYEKVGDSPVLREK